MAISEPTIEIKSGFYYKGEKIEGACVLLDKKTFNRDNTTIKIEAGLGKNLSNLDYLSNNGFKQVSDISFNKFNKDTINDNYTIQPKAIDGFKYQNENILIDKKSLAFPDTRSSLINFLYSRDINSDAPSLKINGEINDNIKNIKIFFNGENIFIYNNDNNELIKEFEYKSDYLYIFHSQPNKDNNNDESYMINVTDRRENYNAYYLSYPAVKESNYIFKYIITKNATLILTLDPLNKEITIKSDNKLNSQLISDNEKFNFNTYFLSSSGYNEFKNFSNYNNKIYKFDDYLYFNFSQGTTSNKTEPYININYNNIFINQALSSKFDPSKFDLENPSKFKSLGGGYQDLLYRFFNTDEYFSYPKFTAELNLSGNKNKYYSYSWKLQSNKNGYCKFAIGTSQNLNSSYILIDPTDDSADYALASTTISPYSVEDYIKFTKKEFDNKKTAYYIFATIADPTTIPATILNQSSTFTTINVGFNCTKPYKSIDKITNNLTFNYDYNWNSAVVICPPAYFN